MRGPGRAAGALALATLLAAACAREPGAEAELRLVPLRTFPAPEARQAVAVDAEHFYAIDDRRIGKYAKASGERIALWEGREDGPIHHLNSGVVFEGRLHCAHSNYPELPMRSSIEVFDARTLAPLASYALGALPGSATWVDRRAGETWLGLANYTGRGGAPGRGPEHTLVARLDPAWRVERSLRFPAEVIERFGTRSNSGGAFGPGGLLFATGHDAAELYLLRIPDMGEELALVGILAAPATGQGIAWDPGEPELLWTIRRDAREVVSSRLHGAARLVARSPAS